MVEFTYQMILSTVQTIGILIGIYYYVMTLRNQNRTHQAQLLMNLYESYRSKESRLESLEIQSWKWNDWDDFFNKYGQQNNPEAWATWEAKSSFFNGVGILLKRNLIDIKLLDDLLTNPLKPSML